MILKFGIALLILAVCYVIWQAAELTKFNESRYGIASDKLKSPHRFVVISDLHQWRYGKHNERLIKAVRDAAPELILIPGDLIVSNQPQGFAVVRELLAALTEIAPVYFANGNHESRLEDPEYLCFAEYQQLKREMAACGVHILNNARETISIGGDTLSIVGLELPLYYYRKGVHTALSKDALRELLGDSDPDTFEILLAHTPTYLSEYFDWGADLILSGHYHGGLVCLPGIGSIISPQFELFPKHSFGKFEQGQATALVSRGMGTHTFHIRIFNRSELLIVENETDV
jgi:predicted MPP superfamily phosphohydrolase